MLRVFFAFSLTLLFISCNNEDDADSLEGEVEVANFFGLKVGNTYTYSYHIRINDTEFETTSWTDEVEITAEVIINGNTYFEYTTTTSGDEGTSFPGLETGVKITTIRDVSGELQNETGAILFSNVENSEPYIISQADWGDVFGERLNEEREQAVPAGTFNCNANNKYAIINSTGEQAPGLDVILYSDGIGEVYSTISTVSNPVHMWEKRLVAYTIAD